MVGSNGVCQRRWKKQRGKTDLSLLCSMERGKDSSVGSGDAKFLLRTAHSHRTSDPPSVPAADSGLRKAKTHRGLVVPA
jgi:hypothetical protein